mgnify:CR=1 FL=1
MFVSPFQKLFNEYQYEKTNTVDKAINALYFNSNSWYYNNRLMTISTDNIREAMQYKLKLENSEYIDCTQYIEKIYAQKDNFVFNTYLSSDLNSFLKELYRIIMDDRFADKEILGIMYKYNDKMINLLHPLNILNFCHCRKSLDFDNYELTFLLYPKEYIDQNINNCTEDMFYNSMVKTLSVIVNNLGKNIVQDETEDVYIDFNNHRVFKSNCIKSQAFVFPVDKMASTSLVPFYGWNYAVYNNNKFIGESLVCDVNKTGNISSKGVYCTGKLPTNIEGLQSLRGNNLASSYTNKCIDIKHNYSWIKANIRVTKMLIEKGLKSE